MRSIPLEICLTLDRGIKSSERKRISFTSSLLSNRDSLRIIQRCGEGLLSAIVAMSYLTLANCMQQYWKMHVTDYEQLNL